MSGSGTALRVLVVDDLPVVRRGLRDLLESTGRYRVVAGAATAAAAEAACRAQESDVAVVDLRLADATGDHLTERLVALWPRLRVLVVTLHATPATAARCLAAGASGMVSKEAEPEDLLRAVDAVAAGQQLLGPGLAAGPVRRSRLHDLTPRERDVAAALARGLTNAQIAGELHLSPKTVRNLVSTVLMRLGVPDRVSAALLYAQEMRGAD